MIVAITRRGQCRRQGGVPGGIDDVRRHRPGQVGVQGERQQIGLEVGSPRRRGNARWLSTRARPWPGACLPTGCTPAASSPAANARPSRATATRLVGEGAVADRRTCAPGMARSSTGAATTSKPAAAQSSPISAPVSQARAARLRRSARAPADARASAAAAGARPGRLPDPPSAPRPAAATRRSAAVSAAQLRRVDGCCARTGSRRTGGCAPEQRRLVGRQRRAGDPDDGGLQNSATEQPTPLARIRSQKLLACAHVAEAAGAHPPQRPAVVLGLADRRLALAAAGRAGASTAAATRPSRRPRSPPRRAGPRAVAPPGACPPAQRASAAGAAAGLAAAAGFGAA